MYLSVIIPAFNEEKIVGETINHTAAALNANQAEDFTWEIIVCDNNSTDETAVIATQAGATVVFEPKNHISKARNRGAAAAQGTWLIFMDADTYPVPGTISDVLTLIRTGDHIGCGSTIKVEGGPFWYRLNLQGHNLEWRLLNTCIGVFILCRADAFKALNGFDTTLYAFEDLDFVLRLKQYGRSHQKPFITLHRHPVITSGRKGDLYGRWTMTKSSLIALWAYITKRKISSEKALPFWYDGRR